MAGWTGPRPSWRAWGPSKRAGAAGVITYFAPGRGPDMLGGRDHRGRRRPDPRRPGAALLTVRKPREPRAFMLPGGKARPRGEETDPPHRPGPRTSGRGAGACVLGASRLLGAFRGAGPPTNPDATVPLACLMRSRSPGASRPGPRSEELLWIDPAAGRRPIPGSRRCLGLAGAGPALATTGAP